MPEPTDPRLAEGETVRHTFRPDRGVYLRDNAWMAAVAMAGGMAILWLMGNPHVWTGAIGGLAAIALRAWYLSDEEFAVQWLLTDTRLLGPNERVVRLGEITKLNKMASTVQIITSTGDKHLMKYQGNRDDTIRRLQSAAGLGAPE